MFHPHQQHLKCTKCTYKVVKENCHQPVSEQPHLHDHVDRHFSICWLRRLVGIVSTNYYYAPNVLIPNTSGTIFAPLFKYLEKNNNVPLLGCERSDSPQTMRRDTRCLCHYSGEIRKHIFVFHSSLRQQ